MTWNPPRALVLIYGLAIFAALTDRDVVVGSAWAGASDAVLPSGVETVWELDRAHRDTTATRERVCLNGLWRWQPAKSHADAVPADKWGYFKAPGFWPGTNSYIQEDCQTLFALPSWKDASLRNIAAAWYQREIE